MRPREKKSVNVILDRLTVIRLGFVGAIFGFLAFPLVLAGCTPGPETAVTLTLLAATATTMPTATAVSPTLPATATTTPTATPIPPTPEPATATPTAESLPVVETRLLTTQPVFVGDGVRLLDWSPDGRYLAYFQHSAEQLSMGGKGIFPPGILAIYDTVSGQSCPHYEQTQAIGGGPESFLDHPHTWLPAGRLLILTENARLLLLEAPCDDAQEITQLFPEPIRRVVNSSPDGQWLLVAGQTTSWLYNLATAVVRPIVESQGVLSMVWSPDGRYLVATLADLVDGGAQSGGSRIIDAATGAVIAAYNWRPLIDLGGTPSGPLWLNNTEILAKSAGDQGPFIMTVAGEVRPILPLFGLEFGSGQTEYWASGYVEPATGHYHILLEGATQSGEVRLPSKVYHSDTDSVEVLPTSPPNYSLEPWVYLDPDGTLSAPGGRRPITAVGQPFDPTAVEAECPEPYKTSFIDNQFALAHYAPPACDIDIQWKLAYLDQISFSATAFALFLPPPGNKWLAVATYDGLEATLFVLDLASSD